MDIITAKATLKEKGYCWFNLKELNCDHYQYISNLFKCSSETNLKSVFKSIRSDYYIGDSDSISVNNRYESIEKAEEIKIDIIRNATKIHQIWKFASFQEIYAYLNIAEEEVVKVYHIINSIINHFYELNETDYNPIEFTYYDKDCRLEDHNDGPNGGRLCACLIYLNEDYHSENGGILRLNGETDVIPELGNVAIIDLHTFNPSHMVTPVVGGVGRFTLLTFYRINSL